MRRSAQFMGQYDQARMDALIHFAGMAEIRRLRSKRYYLLDVWEEEAHLFHCEWVGRGTTHPRGAGAL